MFQHGFPKGLSSGTRMVFQNFAKAFDSVDHQRLLGKVDYCGIRFNVKLLIKDFLTDRLQREVVNGSYTSWSPIKIWRTRNVIGHIQINLLDTISSSNCLLTLLSFKGKSKHLSNTIRLRINSLELSNARTHTKPVL